MGFENGKLVRVVIRATAAGDEVVNVWHYDLVDVAANPANDPQALADAFRDDVVPHFKALFVSAWQIEPIEVTQEKDPQQPNAPRQQWVSGTPTAGTKVLGTQGVANAIAMVASLKTDHIGRRATGRKFVPGSYSEADVNGNNFETSAMDGVNFYLNAVPRQPDIQGGPSSSTANLVVYSRTNRAADIDPYASHVQSIILHQQIHWLRSRELVA